MKTYDDEVSQDEDVGTAEYVKTEEALKYLNT